jgi:hypothetical protein
LGFTVITPSKFLLLTLLSNVNHKKFEGSKF